MNARVTPPFPRAVFSLFVLLGASASVAADRWTNPYEGVWHLHRTTTSPALNIHALVVNLDESTLSLTSTTYPLRRQTTSGFATAVGAQIAINGDLFSYADYLPKELAAGSGTLWPGTVDSSIAGAFAFGGPGNRAALAPASQQVAFDPSWMWGVVSGKPGIVENGRALDNNPYGEHCTLRHPRTAIGLSQNKRTLYLAVIDGRSSTSTGMTCNELAALMVSLGSFSALSVDGGGSSTLFMDTAGVVNVPSDGVERVVANHLALYAEPKGSAVLRRGALFNNPRSTNPAVQYAIIDQIEQAIDGAVPGSTLRIATHALELQKTADKLIAAFRRGVKVRLIVDGHVVSPQTAQLQRELGTNVAAGSFVKVCLQSCMSGTVAADMNAKLYAFSSTLGASSVAMVSSSNLVAANATATWNNLYTFAGEAGAYGELTKYFDDMSKDVANLNYYREITAATFKYYLFPRAGSGDSTDPVFGLLGNVSCTGTAAGYGVNGRTAIRVVAHKWDRTRLSVARRLWELDNAGCDVQVILNGAPYTDREVFAALLKTGGRNGGVVVYDACIDTNGNGIRDTYPHSNYVLVDGLYKAVNQKHVWTGSPDLTSSSVRVNTEVLLKLFSAADHAAFRQNFSSVAAFPGVRRITSVP